MKIKSNLVKTLEQRREKRKTKKGGGRSRNILKGIRLNTANRINKVMKKWLVWSLVAIFMLQAVMSTVLYAQGNNYELLGTNVALGSPILDPNFSAEQWNKWEMITWGVFLSNFAVPLVDDYDSAFNSNSTNGSKGSGYKALQFGSGSDPANSETIKGLLNYAVQQQKTGGLKEIQVTFNDIKRDKVTQTAITDANANALRPATFKDMFLTDDKKNGDSWVKLDDATGVNNFFASTVPIEGNSTQDSWSNQWGKWNRYPSIVTIREGKLPTFYVKYGSGYEKVFDYTDGWDAQILTAWISRIACGDFKKQFKDLFNDMWSKSTELKLYLDTFGNIVTQYNGSRRIVIPASTNQHLTNTPKINLLSSMIFNGLNSGLSAENLNLMAQQSVSGWFGTDFRSDIRFGGLPALGSHLDSVPQGMISLYYDLDTIVYNNYFHGGELSTGQKDVAGESQKANGLHYGKAVKALFDLDANNSVGNDYILKIEAANMDKFDFGLSDKNATKCLQTMLKASGEIANIAGTGLKAEILSKVKTTNGDVSLFSDPEIIPVQMNVGKTNNKINDAGVGRKYIQYVYETYKGGKHTLAGDVKSEFISTLLSVDQSKTMADFRQSILGVKDKTISSLMAGFIADNNNLYRLNVEADKLNGAKLTDERNPFQHLSETKVNGKSALSINYGVDATLDYFPGRLIKAYPTSEVMRAVGNVLGVREGTEFSLYSTYIYMTYLDWYKVDLNKLTGEASSDFNTHLFEGGEDVLNVDIQSVASVKSEEDKKKEVLDYTYMLLHPTEGKEYRNKMMNSYISNFVYDNYQKIVYGNATSFYSNISSNLATRSATGFLSLESYSDNFMTAWFMKLYTKIAIILIAVSFVLIIIVGLLKGRKTSWFIIALLVVINTILIVPSSGELTPVLANKYVQSIFKDKMTYWGISESVTNANLEKQYVDKSDTTYGYLSGMSKEDQEKVIQLVKSLNVCYLDRALMIKQDISRKVTQTQSGNFADVQKLKSARWMLPMIMRQFSANDSSADYVYIPLGDMYDDMSNLYWMYKPDDAAFSGTVAGQQTSNKDSGSATVATTEKPIPIADRGNYYPDYKNTSTTSSAKIPYRSEAYYTGKTLDDMPHTYSYLLKTNAVPLKRSYGFGGEYINSKSFDKYISMSSQAGKVQPFISTATALEQQAGNYNRFDRSTMKQSYGYLWATESPYNYFYQSVKDNFGSDISLGALIGKLQGQYTKTEKNGEIRTSFMHAGDTGYIKDVLDLQEMFTNMVPYLYEMQITAGGDNGTSGVLGDSLIENYDIYKKNYKSWLFRSNWATKLMESPEFTKATTVKDSKGKEYVVANPMLTDCYPTDRPMIFSEAQMHEFGLHESDLNIVELKAIQVNKDISKKWTLLINYANIDGMTKEVLMRQMATDAITTFNAEFSPSGIMNSAYEMYPNGIDLRAISFDSVMKMLMLNVTKNTSYIYGDTMKTVVDNADIGSAVLLLLSAFLCSFIIPLIRNITMGLIFYLGFMAIIYALLASNKQKAKTSCGYFISNMLFLGITMIYYAVFKVLTAVTTSDTVLTVQSVQINAGNPVWVFLIIIGVSIAYIVAMLKMINFCFKYYRDMGMEVYVSIAGMVLDKSAGKLSKLGDKLANFGNDSPVQMSNRKGKSDSNNTDNITKQYMRDNERSRYETSVGNENKTGRGRIHDAYDSKTYKYTDESTNYYGDFSDINNEIEKGRKMNKEESKERASEHRHKTNGADLDRSAGQQARERNLSTQDRQRL